jgi:mediator of RNA polymerase II transcription subunit 21
MPFLILSASKHELVSDLMFKAKQVEVLIESLPQPEAEEIQAKRLQVLEDEMNVANEEYFQALERSSMFHHIIHNIPSAVDSFCRTTSLPNI